MGPGGCHAGATGAGAAAALERRPSDISHSFAPVDPTGGDLETEPVALWFSTGWNCGRDLCYSSFGQWYY